MPVDTLELERISAAGWPGLRGHRIGDWWLRAGHGFTGRANSALVLGDPDRSLHGAVTDVVAWYRDIDIEPRFQIPTGTDVPSSVTDADAHLASAGWTVGDRVQVLAGSIATALQGTADRTDLVVTTQDRPGPAWSAHYLYRGNPLPPTAVAVVLAGSSPTFLTVSSTAGEVLGVGRGVVDEGWLGVTAVTVTPAARRQGIGSAVMAGLLRWGAEYGAEQAYLQVEHTNAGASALYARLGFVPHHGYHYRLQPAGRT